MYKSYLLIIGFLLILTSSAQQLNDWENPDVTGLNKNKPHATLVPYPDERMALENIRENSPYFKLLNGNWKFNWVEQPADFPVGFYLPEYDDSLYLEVKYHI
jgi:beta-galactosidase